MVLIALVMVMMFRFNGNPATYNIRRENFSSLSAFSRMLASTASEWGIPRNVICNGIFIIDLFTVNPVYLKRISKT
jgi:hypothetical protein